MNQAAGARALVAVVLALTLSAAAIAAPVDAAVPTAVAAPAVCAYLGVINGTRSIDPGFAAGAQTASPSTAPPQSLDAGSSLLEVATTAVGTTSTATATVPLNYCHPLPPIVPVGDTEG